VLHCLESSNLVQTEWAWHHLLHRHVAAALLNDERTMTQSPGGQLASAADAVQGLVQRQYHLEQRLVPTSNHNPNKITNTVLLSV